MSVLHDYLVEHRILTQSVISIDCRLTIAPIDLFNFDGDTIQSPSCLGHLINKTRNDFAIAWGE